MRFVGVILLLALPACMTDGPVTRTSTFTGVTLHRSATTIRFIDTVSRLEVAATVMTLDGHERWVVKTFVTRRDKNYPAIGSAWSLGQRRIDYVADDHRRIGNDRQESGHIRLDREFFQRAARTGFAFELIGLRGRYSITVPPDAFAEALSLYRAANP